MLDSRFFAVRWERRGPHVRAALDRELAGFLASTVRAFAKAVDRRIRAHAGSAAPQLNREVLPDRILIQVLLRHLPPDEPRTRERELAALLELKVVIEDFLAERPAGAELTVDFGKERTRHVWLTVLQHLRHVFHLHLHYHREGRPLMSKPAEYWHELELMVEWLTGMIDQLVSLAARRLPDHPPAR